MARGVSPVVGVVLLVFVSLALSASVIATVQTTAPEPSPTVQLSVSADAAKNRITVTHNHGDVLDVTTLTVSVEIDGEPLEYQPPVPFFAAEGFESGPTGVFNSASENTFSAGDQSSIRLAATNSPALTPGSVVTVTIATETSVLHQETIPATS
jgi:FlaG/FlaF family flagellin (archaellin)